MSRFVVTELLGYITARKSPGPHGLSCHVIDTAWNRRLVATYRSEDLTRRNDGRTKARKLAREHAERLNAAL